MSFLSSPEARLALALAIGLVIGAERERRNSEREHRGPAGLRTFGLVGLLGGIFGYLGQVALAGVGAAVVGLLAAAAYVVNREDPDRGLTTELALVVTYGLGLLALSYPALAAGTATVVAAVLALRGRLHKLTGETLTNEELRDGLIFLLFALVVLPMAPDVSTGPYGAINPQSLSRLVVVLMFLTGMAQMAQRLLGPRFGLSLTGFVGGFVSSSATIAMLGAWAKQQPAGWRNAVAGGLASSIATIVQYVVIIAVVDPRLGGIMAPALGAAGVVAVMLTATMTWSKAESSLSPETKGRAFQLWAALGFALIYTLVSIASAALQERIGAAGIVIVSIGAAFVDAHSTAGSVASLHHAGNLAADTAELAIVSALSANTLTKIVLSFTGGHMKYGLWVSAGVMLIAASAWAGRAFL